MDLYMKGISYRGIQDTLRQFRKISVHHTTIMRWIHDYMEKINNYVSAFEPKVGGLWHADEQIVKVKGNIKYVWNCLDSRTRFLLASQITADRTILHAQKLFRNAKKSGRRSARKVITDGCQVYDRAVRHEFATNQNRKPHIRYVSLRQETGNNNKLERFHSSFRQRDKTMRGFKRMKSTGKYVANYRTYYNFIRIHQALDKTPAQEAGLDVPADWKTLLLRSTFSEKGNKKLYKE